ncbi:MAG TPA: hypothetical protein PLZ43_15175 [bacterium]|nr:hypothetical protein [bacterium]
MAQNKTFSWNEFKAKVTVENKLPEEISQKSDKEKIDHFLNEYEEKATLIGSIYWIPWEHLTAENKKFGEWLKKRLKNVAITNDSALKPHPAIQYFSKHKKAHWFSGTSNKKTAESILKIFAKNTLPFVIKEGSVSYIYKYRELKSQIKNFSDYSSFVNLWAAKTKYFPEKGHGASFYSVSQETMFNFTGELIIDNYVGTISKEKSMEMRSLLSVNGTR